ncbi:MAG: PAS domain-containing protein [Deltaproteobacteria bacterium]|nr:PAS domain-containing protein [Deltaproteobacteria bacterium]
MGALLVPEVAVACAVEIEGETRWVHAAAEALERVRAARGADPLVTVSALHRTLLESGLTIQRRGPLRPDDRLERVRAAARAEVVVAAPLRAGGRAVGALVVFTDSSEPELASLVELVAACLASSITHARAHEELAVERATSQMLRALLEEAPQPSAHFDEAGRVIAANPAFRALWSAGLDPYGATPTSLSLPGAPLLEGALRRVLASGAPIDDLQIATLARFVASRRSWLVALHPVRAADGRAVGVGATFTEITEQRRTEAVLRARAEIAERVQRARDTEEACGHVVRALSGCIGDVVAVHSLRARASSVVACAPDTRAIRGAVTPLQQRLDAAARPRGVAAVRASGGLEALDGEALSLLARSDEALRRARDELHLSSVLILPLLRKEAVSFVLTIGRDARGDEATFTPMDVALARELAELAGYAMERGAERGEVERASELLDDYVSFASRELRDAATVLYTRLFVAEAGDGAPAPERDGPLRAAAERLRAAVDRAFAAPPRTPQHPAEHLVDLGAVARELLGELEAELGDRGARVTWHIDEGSLVRGDPTRLADALRALTTHAVARAPRGGLVGVRVEGHATEISVSVSHTGPGYDAAQARRLFDALWSGDHGARRLTEARAIVRRHGGRAWVETAEGAGAAYCFSLPREQRARDSVPSRERKRER